MPRVLILGTGLVGTFTARDLEEHNIAIVAADVSPEPDYFFRYGPRKSCALLTADILDFDSIRSLIDSCDVDAVVLTAGLTSADCEHDPRKAWEVNSHGPAFVARAALEAGVKRFVFVSTFAVYGRPYGASIAETMPLRPLSEYGRTKVMAEEAIANFRKQGLDVRILRSCGVYGPLKSSRGSHSAKFIEALLHHALRTRELEVGASPNIDDEYLYVKDLARAISLATLSETTSPEFIFNVGAGVRTTIEELCRLVERVSPELRIKIRREVVKELSPMPPLDTSLIQNVYGFKPHYSLAEGFFDYLQETRLRL